MTKKNKGFTLVEVLIAITILAIIVTPLLHAFVTAANVNSKSRRLLDSNTLSQNIIEEVKSTSLGELDSLYDYVETTIDEVTGLATHRYIKSGVDAGNTTYDVEIEIKENASAKKQLADINSMNQKDCGYFVQDESIEQKAASYFQAKNAAHVYEAVAQKDTAEFQKMMSRRIDISVEEDFVDVTYTYEIPSGYTAPEDQTFSTTTRIFDILVNDEELKAVYLYYYPQFGSGTDTIRIENSEQLDVDIFLIKMDIEGTELIPTIILDEGVNGIQREYATQICTNLEHYNLRSTEIPVKDLGNTEETVSLYDIEVKVYRHQEDEDLAFGEDYLIDTYTASFMEQTQESE